MPNISLPMSSMMPTSPPTSRQPHRVNKAPVTHVSGAQGSPSRPLPQQAQVELEANQIALTQTALESWGQKQVTWGKKNKGQVYVNVYEKDAGYVKWVLARVRNLHEDIEDFANFAITRQGLENVAMQNVKP